MLIDRLNLEKELLAERRKFKSEVDVLDEVKAIFSGNDNERAKIKDNLKKKSSTETNQFDFDLLETDKIIHLKQIKSFCIDYRLRFLDSDLFKGSIPEEAISKIRLMEKNHGTVLGNFKILAPSKAFDLMNYDDPILFVPLGNDYYYLIHKWGNDLSALRKYLVLPIKNLWNFILACLIVSLAITLAVPTNDLSKSVPLAPVIIFLFAFKTIVFVFGWYFFMSGKNFNTEIWQRKYYNN